MYNTLLCLSFLFFLSFFCTNGINSIARQNQYTYKGFSHYTLITYPLRHLHRLEAGKQRKHTRNNLMHHANILYQHQYLVAISCNCLHRVTCGLQHLSITWGAKKNSLWSQCPLASCIEARQVSSSEHIWIHLSKYGATNLEAFITCPSSPSPLPSIMWFSYTNGSMGFPIATAYFLKRNWRQGARKKRR